MKMNLDCIRDILLEVEDLPLEPFGCESLVDSIEKHGAECVEYNVLKLVEAGFLRGIVEEDLSGIPSVIILSDITFPGHQFLEKIRDHKAWKLVKTVTAHTGSRAFDLIAQISSNVFLDIALKFMSDQP